MMAEYTLHFLGPTGTFTHQAAIEAAKTIRPSGASVTLTPEPDVPTILDAVQRRGDWGIIAWENNVEGYVVPNLDALIDADNVVGFARVGVNVSFDAFTLPGTSLADCRTVTAHPHGLAQCRRFTADHQLQQLPASSNGAACRDLEPGQVALGPNVCGDLYNLTRVACAVGDYAGARTEFLALAPRDEAITVLRERASRTAGDETVESMPAPGATTDPVSEYESIIAFIPLSTGPGVLANLLDVLRDAGLNMTSFISRPIKGRDGTYSFIATIDAAPWQEHLRDVLTQVVDHGDWVKTLAVYPRRERPNPPIYAWSLPNGGVRREPAAPGIWTEGDTARRELLW